MNDAVTVGFGERLGNLAYDLDGSRNREGIFLHQVAKRLALDQLHDDVGLAAFGLAIVMNRGDMRMRKGGDGACFPKKADAKMRVLRVAVGMQGLDGHTSA